MARQLSTLFISLREMNLENQLDLVRAMQARRSTILEAKPKKEKVKKEELVGLTKYLR